MTHVLVEKPEDVKRLPVIFSQSELKQAVGHLVNSLEADADDVHRFLTKASKKELQTIKEKVDECLRAIP